VVAEALRGADAVEEYNVNIGGQPYVQHRKQYKRKRLEVWNSDDGWERRRAAPQGNGSHDSILAKTKHPCFVCGEKTKHICSLCRTQDGPEHLQTL